MTNDTETPNVNSGEQNVPENLAEQSGLPNMSSTKPFTVQTDTIVLGDVYANNFIGNGAAGGIYATQVGFNPNDPLDVASLVMDAGTDGTDGYITIPNITADGTVDFTGATLIGIPDLVGISLTDLSVSVNAVGVANLAYDNTTGVFTYTPPSFAGYLPLSGGTLTGSLVFEAGNGILLGGTGAANKLDSYEEGTWTPTGVGLALGSPSGTYTKVGRLVTVNWLFVYPTTTSGSQSSIEGLPFTVDEGYVFGGNHGYVNGSAAASIAHITAATTSIIYRTANGGVALTHADLSGATIRGSMTYMTA